MSNFLARADTSHIDLKLAALPSDVRASLLDAVVEQGGALLSLARVRAMTLLRQHTGKFAAAITFGVHSSGTEVRGSVSNAAPAAAILEFGGTIKPHDILPNKARALRFNGRFAARVHHPGAVIAARDIIGGAFDEKRSAITAALENAVAGAAERAST